MNYTTQNIALAGFLVKSTNDLKMPDLFVVGGGLAGSESVWQATQRGLKVHLYEMRPTVTTGVHAGISINNAYSH